MSIWMFSDHLDFDKREKFPKYENCIYCKSKLEILSHEIKPAIKGGYWHGEKIRVSFCPICGWWTAHHELYAPPAVANVEGVEKTSAAISVLKNLDVADINSPIDEVKKFLLVRYESRFSLHPRLFEETVGSVFKSLGYHIQVTGYSGDDGVDVILENESSKIGVQVKRYRNSIKVEQIRSLVGALVLKGMTKGIFVSTSTFQSGATNTVNRFEEKGYSIELYDAKRFYDALRLSQRPEYTSLEDFLSDHPINSLPVIHRDSYY